MVPFLISRPIATLTVCLAFVVSGLVVAGILPVSLMPEVDIPEVTVQVSGVNQSARELENTVVKPLRQQLAQVPGLEDIHSETRNGNGLIRLSFAYGTRIDYAFLDVNEKVDAAMANLPRAVERPHVIKANATDIPVFYLNLTLKEVQQDMYTDARFLELSAFADAVIRKRLEQLPEVAFVDITGRTFPEMQIMPDPDKMKSLGISQQDIQRALENNNIELGNLRVRDGKYEYSIRFSAYLRSPEDVGKIYLKSQERLYQLKDIAAVSILPADRAGLYLANGQLAIGLAVIKQSDARMQDLKGKIQLQMQLFEQDYPDIQFELSQDQSVLLEVAIANLRQSLLMGGALAMLVMFFFLKDLKSPLLIALTIPVSVIVSLLLFYLIGISINIISLSGLVLGVGLMIDNAIIVIDNITQKRAEIADLDAACTVGTNEVMRPLISSALTTSAVFLPLIFLSGIAGALFFDQAVAITIGLGVSLMVSITVLPTLYRLFYQTHRPGRFQRWWEKVSLFSVSHQYEKGFDAVFRWKWVFVLTLIAFTVAGGLTLRNLSVQRLPQLTRDAVILHIDWNEHIHVEENRRRTLDLIRAMEGHIGQTNAWVGAQQFLLNKDQELSISEVDLYIKAAPQITLTELEYSINEWLRQAYPSGQYAFSPPPNIFERLFAGESPPLVAKISSHTNNEMPDVEDIHKLSRQLNRSLDERLGLIPVEAYQAIVLDLEKLVLYAVDHQVVYDQLKSALNVRQIGMINAFQQLMPIVISEPEQSLDAVIEHLTIKNAAGIEIPLRALVQMVKSQDYKTRIADQSGGYVPFVFDIGQQDLAQYQQIIRAQVAAAEGLEVGFAGSLFSGQKLVRELTVILGISLLMLYFILAAQFESLVQPLIVLMEVPIDIAGALLVLYFTGSSLNLMSMIGIILMTGIIINDSILKIDTINRLRREGMTVMEAIREGGNRRLLPIVMTSLTTILAVTPFLFGNQLGAELQRPLALALIGGMTVGTVVSLYFIPLAYRFVNVDINPG